MFDISATQVIQAILAPAIMISSCGLILLGLQNRYSFIVNRIRLLNDERRRLQKQLVSGKELDYSENIRFHSVRKQLQELAIRALILRNAILFEIFGAIFFVLTSLLIALFFFIPHKFVQILPIFSFLIGLVSVLLGLIFFFRDILKAYTVIKLETQVEE